MHGGVNRTSHLAGRLFAMHARHRLEEALRIVELAGEIAIDAQPVHLAAPRDLILADDGDIVFRIAGSDTGIAADAGIEIDHQAPGGARIGPLGVHAWLRFWWRKTRMVRRDLTDEIKSVHPMMELRGRERLLPFGAHQCADSGPRVVE